MITTKVYQVLENGEKLILTESDSGHRIIQNGTGITYDSAVDPESMWRTYYESEEMIESEADL
jgi:hypothetical protein